MSFKIGKSLAGSALFVLVVLVGIFAAIVLEVLEAVAVVLAPLFSRRR